MTRESGRGEQRRRRRRTTAAGDLAYVRARVRNKPGIRLEGDGKRRRRYSDGRDGGTVESPRKHDEKKSRLVRGCDRRVVARKTDKISLGREL